MLTIRKTSKLTGIERARRLPITVKQLFRWKEGGELVQDVFPHLSADDREFLMTGITPDEWAKYMGDE